MKKHDPKIEFMTRIEIRQFLTAAKREDPACHAAFLLAINAMLKIKDLMRLKVSDLLRGPDEPCRLKVGTALIELDCETLTVVENWATNRQGKLFPFKDKRAVWKAFRKIIEAGNIYAYTFHALRHTGIMLRAKEVKNLVDQEALRKAARFGRHEQLRPYRMAEESSLVNRVKFPK
jgi:integrase